MRGDAIVLDPGERRRFWTGSSRGVVKVESGSADFSVFESSPPLGVPGPARICTVSMTRPGSSSTAWWSSSYEVSGTMISRWLI
jgi:hypothetical protein